MIPIFTHGIPSNPIIIWDVGWVGSPTLEHREALIPVTSFISTYENRIDKKGRVSVPSAYRLALGNEAYQGVIAYPSLTDTTIEVFGRSTLEQLNQRSFDESLAQGNYAYTLLGSSEDGLIEAIMAIASELPFSPDSIEKDSTLIAISQSGESADVLEAVRIAKKSNAKIISIVNHPNSSLSQESDIVISLNCGPEIGVAATKSFTSQLAILYKITNQLSNMRINLNWEEISGSILSQVQSVAEENSKIRQLAKTLKDVSDIYVLGRGIHFPIAMEAALKLKELTYIHAEGIPGGELKHGPLALMDSNVFVIIINPNDATYTETLNSANEIKARGAKIIGISDKKSDVYDYWIEIPAIDDALYSIIEIIPIQLLAYYSAIEKNTDPDYPRNLAKSVTVK